MRLSGFFWESRCVWCRLPTNSNNLLRSAEDSWYLPVTASSVHLVRSNSGWDTGQWCVHESCHIGHNRHCLWSVNGIKQNERIPEISSVMQGTIEIIAQLLWCNYIWVKMSIVATVRARVSNNIINTSSLGAQFDALKLHCCDNASHGYAHNYTYQLANHPNKLYKMSDAANLEKDGRWFTSRISSRWADELYRSEL